MIPVLVGAAAVGLGAALLSGGDDEPEPAVTQKKKYLSKKQAQQFEQRLNRAGRRIKTVGQGVPNFQASSGRSTSSGDFSADFERVENMLDNPNVSYLSIENELESIKLRANQLNDEKALNFVAYYREKLNNRKTSIPQSAGSSQSGDFSADFERVENMLDNPNIGYYRIDDELRSIEGRAKRRSDTKALNFVAYYREKLNNRKRY